MNSNLFVVVLPVVANRLLPSDIPDIHMKSNRKQNGHAKSRFVLHGVDLETQRWTNGVHVLPIQALQYRRLSGIIQSASDESKRVSRTALETAFPSPSAFASV